MTTPSTPPVRVMCLAQPSPHPPTQPNLEAADEARTPLEGLARYSDAFQVCRARAAALSTPHHAQTQLEGFQRAAASRSTGKSFGFFSKRRTPAGDEQPEAPITLDEMLVFSNVRICFMSVAGVEQTVSWDLLPVYKQDRP